MGHDAHAVIRCKILVFDNRVNVVADVVVAAGACGGNPLAYGHSCPYAHGMNVPVAGCPDLGEPRVDRGGFPVVRSHFRFSILIHAIDGKAHGSRHFAGYRNIAHGAHGVDLALGVRRDVDGRMIVCDIRMVCGVLVDVRVVQSGKAVLVNVRDGGRALEVEVILAPAHADAGAHGNDAGLLQFRLAVFFHRLAVRGGNGNRAVIGRRNVGMVDFRPQPFFVAGGTDRSIGHGAADSHFLAADGNAARDGGLFRNILRHDGKRLHIVQCGLGSVRLAVNDALRVADAPIDGDGAGGAQNFFAKIHVHAAGHG